MKKKSSLLEKSSRYQYLGISDKTKIKPPTNWLKTFTVLREFQRAWSTFGVQVEEREIVEAGERQPCGACATKEDGEHLEKGKMAEGRRVQP